MRRSFLCCIVLATLTVVPIVDACTWGYLIWAIRSKSADPLFRFVRNGKAGFIDARGRIVIEPKFQSGGASDGEFHEGLLRVRDGKTVRYVNQKGETEFQTNSWFALDFSEGLAPAALLVGGVSRDGFIDRAGRFAIKPGYWHAHAFSEGLATVQASSEVNSTGYIDHEGRFVIPPHLTHGSSFHDGLAAAIVDGPCEITNGGSCGRARFRPTKWHPNYDCRYSFIDKTGRPVSDERFDDAMDFSEGLAAVRVGDKWGFADKTGHVAIPPRYESADSFSESLAAVGQSGKIGFIDHSGSFVIQPHFQRAESFSDGRALITEGSKVGDVRYRFIDKTGRPAFPEKYVLAASFAHGLAPVALQRDHYAWIDTSGKVVFRFDSRR